MSGQTLFPVVKLHHHIDKAMMESGGRNEAGKGNDRMREKGKKGF